MAAALLDDPPREENERFLKTYLASTFDQVQDCSPAVAQVFNCALDKYQAWAPKSLQDTVKVAGVDGLDRLDEFLGTVANRCGNLKNLSAEQVAEIASLIKSGAGVHISKVTDVLPSADLEDFAIKEKVNEILVKVLAQPQVIRDQVGEYAESVHSSLDKDQDGIVTVKDLAENVADATKCATELVANTYDSVSNKMVSSLQEVLATPSVEEYILPLAAPYIDSLKTQWERKDEVLKIFLPLWGAIQTLQSYVSVYTSNIQSKFEPLSPWLTQLLGHTSIVDIPIELITILAGSTTGDKERDSVVRETRALFWALIDISFLLEVLRDERSQGAPGQHRNEGVELVKDAGEQEPAEIKECPEAEIY